MSFRRVPVLPFASLRSRLLVVVIAAVTPFVLFAGLNAARDRTIVDASLRAQSLARARTTARSLDERLLEIDRVMDSAMVRIRRPIAPSRTASTASTASTADTAQGELGALLSVAVLDTSGARSALLNGSGTRVDSLPRDRRAFLVNTAILKSRQKRTATPATFVDEGGARNQNDSIALIIVRPMPRLPGCNCPAAAPGVVVGILSDRALQTLLGGDSLPDGSVALLMGTAGQPLGRLTTPERWIERDARDTLVLAAGVEREGVMKLTGQDHVERAVGFAALTRLPWRVYIGVPMAGLAAVPGQQLRDTLMLALLSVVIATVGVILATRAYSGPLQALVADTKRLAAGTLSHRTDVALHGGEIGALGTALNALAADLEARRKVTQVELRRLSLLAEQSPATADDLEAHETPAAPHMPAPAAAVSLAEATAAIEPPGAAPTPHEPAAGSKGDALVRFAGHIADDLHELLSALATYSQLAADSSDDPDMRAIALERIHDLTLSGLALARQMRSYGELDALQLTVLDANEALSEVMQAMAETLGRDVELDVRYNVAPALVRVDAALLHHAIAVLVANARDAMPAGGTLTLATTFVAVPEDAYHRLPAPAGEYVVLTVADTGLGMTEAARRRIFEPFYSTKRHLGPRVGLGLASVDGIAREHGWHIDVDSEPDVGTAISIYMPVVPDPPALTPPPMGQSIFDTAPASNW